MKRYRSTMYSARWLVFSRKIGWLMFPAEVGGWKKREPARGIGPLEMREIPLSLESKAGIPSAPTQRMRLLVLRSPR